MTHRPTPVQCPLCIITSIRTHTNAYRRLNKKKSRRFFTPIVAVGAVDLAPKLPWSSSYVPPASMHIRDHDIMGATGAPVFAHMFDVSKEVEADAKDTVDVSAEPPPRQVPDGAGGAAGVDGRVAGAVNRVRSADRGAAAGAGGAMALLGDDGGKVGSGGVGGASGNGATGLGASAGWSTGGAEAGMSNPMFVTAGPSRAAVGQAPVPALPSASGGTSRTGSAANHKASSGAHEEQVPLAPEIEVVEVMGQEDEGAGVFGAIFHQPGEGRASVGEGGVYVVILLLGMIGCGGPEGGSRGLSVCREVDTNCCTV